MILTRFLEFYFSFGLGSDDQKLGTKWKALNQLSHFGATKYVLSYGCYPKNNEF